MPLAGRPTRKRARRPFGLATLRVEALLSGLLVQIKTSFAFWIHHALRVDVCEMRVPRHREEETHPDDPGSARAAMLFE